MIGMNSDRRGFEPIVDEFLCSKRKEQPSISIEDALKTHKLCEEILKQIRSNIRSKDKTNPQKLLALDFILLS